MIKVIKLGDGSVYRHSSASAQYFTDCGIGFEVAETEDSSVGYHSSDAPSETDNDRVYEAQKSESRRWDDVPEAERTEDLNWHIKNQNKLFG